jgi:hypothetical protein
VCICGLVLHVHILLAQRALQFLHDLVLHVFSFFALQIGKVLEFETGLSASFSVLATGWLCALHGSFVCACWRVCVCVAS